MAHVVVTETMPASSQAVFDVIHDYDRRLEWDTLLSAAEVLDGDSPGPGVRTRCRARPVLGGYAFTTKYITLRPPQLAAVALERPIFVFTDWAASMRHRDISADSSTVTYTMTFSCRPSFLAGIIEPVAARVFQWETRRRLQALARYVT